MRHLLLPVQEWWDAQRFDQPGWQVATWREQKVRHIQLHVAKALGKVLATVGEGGSAASSMETLARVKEEVLPDVAIYRSQLINLFPDCWHPAACQCFSIATGAIGSHVLPPRGPTPGVEGLSHVVHALALASAQLAAYIEPREHGVASPTTHICEAVQHLHASAEALAATFAVDLPTAHRARLEALLGTPLPDAIIKRAGENHPK